MQAITPSHLKHSALALVVGSVLGTSTAQAAVFRATNIGDGGNVGPCVVITPGSNTESPTPVSFERACESAPPFRPGALREQARADFGSVGMRLDATLN